MYQIDMATDTLAEIQSVQASLDQAVTSGLDEGAYLRISELLKRLYSLEQSKLECDASEECESSEATSIVASYEVKTVFAVPTDMDRGRPFHVKYDQLHYHDAEGREHTVEPSVNGSDTHDFKWPDRIVFSDEGMDAEIQ